MKLIVAVLSTAILMGCSPRLLFHESLDAGLNNRNELGAGPIAYPKHLNIKQIKSITRDLMKKNATCFLSEIPSDVFRGRAVCAYLYCFGYSSLKGYVWRFHPNRSKDYSDQPQAVSFPTEGWAKNLCVDKKSLLRAQHIFARKEFYSKTNDEPGVNP